MHEKPRIGGPGSSPEGNGNGFERPDPDIERFHDEGGPLPPDEREEPLDPGESEGQDQPHDPDQKGDQSRPTP